jgi:hypothetical protein
VALIVKLLFFPGNVVLKLLGVSVAEDSGILRSMVNSIVWGAVALAIGLHYLA